MALIYNLDHILDKQTKTNIRKALAFLEKAYYSKVETTSFFLDPYEQKVISDIATKNNIDIAFIGGNPDAERKMFVANYYYLPLYEPNYLSVLEFDSCEISHPDVLGALLSLGVDRNQIGDISILDSRVEFVIDKGIASFVEFNLTKIKNEKIQLKEKEAGQISLIPLEYEYHKGFVSSRRLDNLVAEFISTSRGKAKELVAARMVKVDFQTIDNPSYRVNESSLISIRKNGRFIYDSISGLSKKGNYHIEYRKIKWYIYL